MYKFLTLKNINCITYICMFWKGICPFLGFAYLITWLTQFFNERLYALMNEAFGFLPNLINKLMPIQEDLMGMDVPMGHIHAAAIIIVSMYFATKIETYVAKIKAIKEKEIADKKIKILEKEKRQKEKQYIQKLTHFFGLCELKLEYSEKDNTKSIDDLKKLKKEYSKMIIQKTKAKFPQIYYTGTDKIYFIGDDYEVIDVFLTDIIQYFKIFQEIDNKKMIKTDLILSIVGGNQHNNPKMIYKFLLKINELKYLNQIIVNDKFATRYNKNPNNKFETYSLGFSHIEMNINNLIETELYKLKKK